ETEFRCGEIYDVDGNFLGEHHGIELFTIVQRKGLPGRSPRPRYVVDLDPRTDRVVVGDGGDQRCDELEIDRVHWHPVADTDSVGSSFEETLKLRYSQPGTPATVTPLGNDRARVRLHESQRALTPGQAAVNSDDDVVLGGGWICRREALAPA